MTDVLLQEIVTNLGEINEKLEIIQKYSETVHNFTIWQFAILVSIFSLCILIFISQYLSKLRG